jgi:hypothetical protein
MTSGSGICTVAALLASIYGFNAELHLRSGFRSSRRWVTAQPELLPRFAIMCVAFVLVAGLLVSKFQCKYLLHS